jgi:WD40 repeat protein
MVRIWDARKATLRVDEDRTGAVTTVAIAPDGTWLATVSGLPGDTVVQIWDTASRAQKATLTGDEDKNKLNTAVAVAIAPDGTWLAIGGSSLLGRGMVQIWDTASWAQKATVSAEGLMNAVAIAPDGTWLATGGGALLGRGMVQIWDTASWAQKATLTSHEGAVNAVAIAPDGTWLAAVSGNILRGGGMMQIWDTANWAQKATLTIDQDKRNAVSKVAIAPDGTWLATVGGAVPNREMVQIWDTASWAQKATLTIDEGGVNAIAIVPDGTLLAIGGNDGTLRISNVATGSALAMMRVDSVIRTCAWIDSRGIVGGGNAGLYMFDFLAGAAT